MLWAPLIFCAAVGAENPYKVGLEDLGNVIHPVTECGWDPGWVTELDAEGERRGGKNKNQKNLHQRLQALQEQGLATPSAAAAPPGLLAKLVETNHLPSTGAGPRVSSRRLNQAPGFGSFPQTHRRQGCNPPLQGSVGTP